MSASSPQSSPFSNKWSVTVQSPRLSLKTWIEPAWTIEKAIDTLKRKFSKEASEYVLFLETDKNFLLLDNSSCFEDFPQITNNSTLIFNEKTYKGTKEKPVILSKPKRPASVNLTPTSSASGSLLSPSGPSQPRSSPISSPALQRPTRPHSVNFSSDSPLNSPTSSLRRDLDVRKSALMNPSSARTLRGTKQGTMRSPAVQAQLDSFFEILVKCSKEILTDVKTIKEMLSTKQMSEDDVFAQAKVTAQRAVELNSIVFSNYSLAKNNPDQYEFVKDASKLVRTNVLSLIQASRNYAANPFDYMTQQLFTRCSKEVVDGIKGLINAADLLQFEDVEQEKQDELNAKALVKVTNELKTTLRAFSNAAYRKEKENFVSAAKTLVMSMNELLNLDQTFKLSFYWELKTATQNFVNAGKQALADSSQFEGVTNARTQLTTVVNNMITTASGKSVEVKKSLRRKEFPDFAIKPPMDAATEKDFRMKKSAAMGITHLLTHKFDAFFKQWTQQTPEDAAEIHDLIVEQMNKHFLMYVAAKEKEEMEKREKERKAEISEEGSRDADDEEAMKELAKIMKMKSADDWQEMALNLRRYTARLDVSKRTLDLENSKDAPINTANIGGEVNTSSKSLHDTIVEFLLTISDIVLDTEKQNKMNQNAEATLTKSVENLLKILRRTALVCKAWLRPNSVKKKLMNSSSSGGKKSGKAWALAVECTEDTITYVKKLKMDVELTVQEVVDKILEKVPVDSNKEYGLYLPTDKIWLRSNKKLQEYPQLSSEKITLQLKEYDVKAGVQIRTIEQMLEALVESIETGPTKGSIQKNIISALTDSNSGQAVGNFAAMKSKLEEDLQDKIYSHSNAVRVLGIQILSSLKVLSTITTDMKDYTGLLQVISSSKQLLPTMSDLLNSFETLYYIRVHGDAIAPSSNSAANNANDSKSIAESDPEPIWADKQKPFIEEGAQKGGTLNALVIRLTSEEIVDSDFLTTFLTTYQSFTTPFVFLQKMLQRYYAPETKVDKERAGKIKLRVCIVLKQWIENHFDDFDERTTQTLKSFATDTLIKDNQEKLSNLLTKELAKKQEDLSAKKKLKLMELTDLKVIEDGRSPADLFMVLNESEIARQLTLIEFKMFSKIKPSELQNQSWNKEKLQHKAPHILAMISRANKLSYWVGSITLWFAKVADRRKVITKLINIAQHLLQLNNFNTLMGFMAGLSASSISRLRHTWADMEPSVKENFAKLKDLFNPSASFKRYRQELATARAKGAVLPYLGTYLSDLTFTEDGNKDFIEEEAKTINWNKRLLVSKLVTEIKMLQSASFAFPVVEPIHTFLTELPHLEEKELYDLSFIREPKGAEVKDIE